jgi:hypothetical protein
VKAFGGTGLLGGMLVLLLLSGCGGSAVDSDPQTSSGDPAVVSASSLRTVVAKKAMPIYWAGERRGTKLELSQPSSSRTYVRYLTGDAKAGDQRADFLTVSTYAQPNAVAALRRQGKQPGGAVSLAPGNATVYFNRTDPRSVYLAYPGVPVEIEVYAPSFKRALQVVNSGQIVAVG